MEAIPPEDHQTDELLTLRRQWRHEPHVVLQSVIQKPINGGHLRFWTSVSTLYVGRERSTMGHSGYRYFLVSFLSIGMAKVWVHLDAPSHLKFDDVNLMSEIPEALLGPLEDLQRRCEVVAISFLVIKVLARSSLNRIYRSDLCALAVEWKAGVAYRVGIMCLEEEEWISLPDREWKQVILG
jgi:hypothetical protein